MLSKTIVITLDPLATDKLSHLSYKFFTNLVTRITFATGSSNMAHFTLKNSQRQRHDISVLNRLRVTAHRIYFVS